MPALKPHVFGSQGARHARQSSTRQVSRGVFVEAAWLTTHIAMYPMGLVEEKAREEVLRHNLEGSRQSSAA